MTTEQARSSFVAARVARLATVDARGRPHLVPVTFAVLTDVGTDFATEPTGVTAVSDRVVVVVDHKPKSTWALKRLANLRGNERACFLADRYAEDWEQLWWVRVDCRAYVRDGPDLAARKALAAKYPQYRERPPSGPMIEATGLTWSGWAAK